MTIRRAVVIGAGTMGAQIAAQLANAGVQVDLLDIVPSGAGTSHEERSQLAIKAIQRLHKMSPAPLFEDSRSRLIQPGNVEDDLDLVKDADWVIEAIIEQLKPKQQLLARIEEHWQPGTWVSTNTSGLPVNDIAQGRSQALRESFFGSHFFNPPRYMELLELIPSGDTSERVLEEFTRFGTRRLGKQVVRAFDTPNFIANRIGIFAVQATLKAMEHAGFDIDTVDAITGQAMGHPRSATFRTMDLVGLDVYLHVVDNLLEATGETIYEAPAFLREMVERGWLGEKSGQGFYKKIKGEDGKSQILSLDLETMEYHPQTKPRFDIVGRALGEDDPGQRLKTLLGADDEVSQFAWEITAELFRYSADKAAEIAPSIEAIDRAIRYGFNWQLGPFETWDALGVQETVERLQDEGDIAQWVVELAESGGSFYDRDSVATPQGERQPRRRAPQEFDFQTASSQAERVIKRNPGATLLDLGDDVAGLFLHGAKNAIGEDTLDMIDAAAEEVRNNYRGLVLGQAGEHFAVGANLLLIMMLIRQGDWDQVDQAVRRFQNASRTLKYLERPVVAAPAGRVLGGGAEFCLHADRVVPAAETYMGLVEVGVGLIPAGGGTTIMLQRFLDQVPGGAEIDRQPLVNKVFELIGTAQVATSALQAKSMGYLDDADSISMNRLRRLHLAKETVLYLDGMGYTPPEPGLVTVEGPDGAAALQLGAWNMLNSGYASEYDQVVASHLARVLTGGDVPRGSKVSEQHLLDLEREAFLSLCGEEKTQARIEHMLTQGKPLRN